MNPHVLLVVFCLIGVISPSSKSEDWPMWRHDSGRTGASAEVLMKGKLRLLWQRHLPVVRPAFRDVRLQFDKGYEPVAAANRLFVGSNLDDSVTAFDASSGKQLWKFFTEGPVRFAPVVWKDRILFGSDDGHLYCLSTKEGKLLWRFRAAPSDRKLTGNKRLISVWPVRGGPVVDEGRVYFAAGVLPFEGVFVYSLDATTGKVLWLNDSSGYIYGQQPHRTEALGGLAPQGYLLVDGEDLVVPCSNAYPARFDLRTGVLKEFKLPSPGRIPGGWFASTPAEKLRQKLKRRGVIFDEKVNRVRHEDRIRQEGLPDLRTTIISGDKEWRFEDGLPEVGGGGIYSMLIAQGKLFVVTLEGRIYAFASENDEKYRDHKSGNFFTKAEALTVKPSAKVGTLLNSLGSKHGLVVVLGGADESMLEAMLADSDFRILVLESDERRVSELRRYLDNRGLYGRWVTVMNQDPLKVSLPHYLTEMVIVDEALTLTPEQLSRCYDFLRPFGGVLIGSKALIDVAEDARLPIAQFESRGEWTLITRQGPLEGSTNYTGNWEKSPDKRVKAPLGTLWFDDSLGLFKRSPQPKVVDGVMISTDKNWRDYSTRLGKVDYRLLPPEFSDIYTGRLLAADEATPQRQSFSKVDLKTVQPTQYRPPGQKTARGTGQPRPGTRRNLLTGEDEPRSFTKQYGCDGGYDYGNIFTMRSATPSFYDKTTESGPINLSGPRSGCTNSLIPAGGVLNIPYFYEGCSCSYPLPIGLSVVRQPQTYEQWTAWGAVSKDKTLGKIQRVGINLGAPGDRVTDDGTLWMDFPSVGGPSPEIELEIQAADKKTFYNHSLWIEGGTGWPWVAASGMEGVQTISLKGVMPGVYSVRLVFVEPDNKKIGERVFDVFLQGNDVLKNFDVSKEAKGRMRAVTRTQRKISIGDDGQLMVKLEAKNGTSILSGIELIRDGLEADEPPTLKERATNPLR